MTLTYDPVAREWNKVYEKTDYDTSRPTNLPTDLPTQTPVNYNLYLYTDESGTSRPYVLRDNGDGGTAYFPYESYVGMYGDSYQTDENLQNEKINSQNAETNTRNTELNAEYAKQIGRAHV